MKPTSQLTNQPTKQLSRIAILLFAVFLCLTGCQKEDTNPDLAETEAAAPEGPYKMSIIDHSKVQQNNKLTAKLSDIGSMKSQTIRSNTQDRIVYNETYDFTIDTDNVTYIESTDGTYHSYTFMIVRPIDNGLLENLSFSLQEDGSYRTFIVVYDLTQQEQEDLDNGLYVAMENRYSITEIDSIDIDPSTSNRMTNKCLVEQSSYWRCGNNRIGHNPDTPRDICQANSFDYIVDLIWGICPVDGGPSNNNPPNNGDNNGNNNGGTGTGGNSGHHIVTSITYSPQPWQVIANCIDIVDFYDVDNAPLLNWLKNNKTLAKQIKTYLITQNGCSEQAQENVIDFIEIKCISVCLNSFEFTDVGSNWQNAGITNVNVQFLTIGWPSTLINVNFPELHFGLPKSLSNGDYITNNNARYEAKDIMTQSELLTNLYQSINPNSTTTQLKTYFLNKMQEISAQRGGTVSTTAPLGWSGQLKPHQTYFFSDSIECD